MHQGGGLVAGEQWADHQSQEVRADGFPVIRPENAHFRLDGHEVRELIHGISSVRGDYFKTRIVQCCYDFTALLGVISLIHPDQRQSWQPLIHPPLIGDRIVEL